MTVSRTTLPVSFPVFLTACLAALMSGAFSVPAFAELVTVGAEGEYRLGDHDTKEDAVRLAIEAAKRHALEQVATYIESVTTASALDITRDEIRTYTAGVVQVSEQRISTRLEGDQIIIHADLIVQIDPEEATLAVTTLRRNDDARQQLQLLRKEVDDLHQQLEATTARLAATASPEHMVAATQQRQDLLNQAQSDEALTQAWTNWALVAPTAYPYPWMGASQVQGLWAYAAFLYPANPHLVVLQRLLPVAVPSRAAPAVASSPASLSTSARGFQPRASSSVGSTSHAFSGQRPPRLPVPPRQYKLPSHPPSFMYRHSPPSSRYNAPRSSGGGGRGGGGRR